MQGKGIRENILGKSKLLPLKLPAYKNFKSSLLTEMKAILTTGKLPQKDSVVIIQYIFAKKIRTWVAITYVQIYIKEYIL